MLLKIDRFERKVIDFEEGTLDEFKNKHVHIGKRIY